MTLVIHQAISFQDYLLKPFTSSANDFSQAYIFIIFIPLITSFMVLILTSVKAAVLLLKTGQRKKFSCSVKKTIYDHTTYL